MERKRKIEILFAVLIVILLALYRNLWAPFLKLWLLISIDMLLRIPGDNILRLLDPVFPASVDELLRILFQIGTALLLWRSGRAFRAFLRGRPMENGPGLAQEETSKPLINRTRQKRLKRLVIIALVLFASLPPVGRSMAWPLALFGVRGYPLHVTTEVVAEGAQHTVDSKSYSFPETRSILPSEEDWRSTAFDFQEKLLTGFRNKTRLLRPGIMRFKEPLPGIVEGEARLVERRALDFLNAFEDLSWQFYSDACWVFSKDGVRATYRVDIYTALGPLAAIGFLYAVELERIGKHWIVIKFGSSGVWLS